MKIAKITIYGVKSNRKNSKFNYKTWTIYKGIPKIKSQFTSIMDFSDMNDFLNINEYDLFRLVVYVDNENLHNWNTTLFYSKESILKRAELFGRMINGL